MRNVYYDAPMLIGTDAIGAQFLEVSKPVPRMPQRISADHFLARGGGLPCGWSATGGQSQSAYVRGGVRPDDTFGGHSVSMLFYWARQRH
jgi:hypothetical protein